MAEYEMERARLPSIPRARYSGNITPYGWIHSVTPPLGFGGVTSQYLGLEYHRNHVCRRWSQSAWLCSMGYPLRHIPNSDFPSYEESYGRVRMSCWILVFHGVFYFRSVLSKLSSSRSIQLCGRRRQNIVHLKIEPNLTVVKLFPSLQPYPTFSSG